MRIANFQTPTRKRRRRRKSKPRKRKRPPRSPRSPPPSKSSFEPKPHHPPPMNNILSLTTLAVLLSTRALPAADKAGFVPLFNGKDTTGWKLRNPAGHNSWSVTDGILNGKKIHDQVECNKATGSEIDNKVTEPGPIFLQGDHGTVWFRNLRIK